MQETTATALDTIISILRCPISGADLAFLDEDSLEALKTGVEEGRFRHRTGEPVRLQVERALSSADGAFTYPVVEGILILLPRLAIVRFGDGAAAAQSLADETDSVMRFYDEIGWTGDNGDGFEDAKRFEDSRPVSSEYVHRCHLRINDHLHRHGRYLLDVASGPVQYREYLTYSQGYHQRICADVSLTALRAAQKKLGDKGIYLQCDITQLPLKSESVDGFVSLHTIYHVPAEKQLAAFRELERVLIQTRTGVVVYSWGPRCLAMSLLTVSSIRQLLSVLLPKRFVAWLKRLLEGDEFSDRSEMSRKAPEPRLYFHAHSHTWFQHEMGSIRGWEIRVWRSVSVPFLQRYVHPQFFGKLLLLILFQIENIAPHFMGRFGQYPMMIFTKRKGGE